MESSLHASIAETLDGLLAGLAARDPGALDALIRATQHDLRRIAHRERLAMGGGETLSTTALVNEAISSSPARACRLMSTGACSSARRRA